MGCNVAPTFVVMYMNNFESCFVYTHPLFNHVKIWLRYIDDIFIVWQGTPEQLETFHKYLNHATTSISLSLDSSPHSFAFLDVLVKITDNCFSFDIYSKPTDRNSLLAFSSCHSPSLIRSLPLSQFMRVKRIVSDPIQAQELLTNMKNKFLTRRYPQTIVNLNLDKISTRPRESLLSHKTTKTSPMTE